MQNPTLFETVGSSVRRQYAQNAGGQWFTRSQERHPRYGYRWSRWTPAAEPQRATWDEGVAGHSDGQWNYGVIRANIQVAVRLPSFVEG
jgi:hypothetical protein